MLLTETKMTYDYCRAECQSYGADLYVPTTDEQFQALSNYHVQQGNGTFILEICFHSLLQH